MSSNYKVASLFCGCGGIDLGLQGGFDLPYQPKGSIERLKFDIIWSNDFNPKAMASYRANFTEHYSICGDIVKIVERAQAERAQAKRVQKDDYNGQGTVKSDIGSRSNLDGTDGKFLFYGPGIIDVVTGGFPCQPFSLAGKRQGLSDKRGKLYEAMLDAVSLLKPKLFIAENVAGLLSAKVGKKPVIEKIEEDFLKIDYELSYKVLVASDFGVPQRRERVIIVGTPKGAPVFDFSEVKLGNGLTRHVSVKKALKELEGEAWNPAKMHVWSRAKFNKGQGNTTCDPDEPAPTMRAEHHGNIEFHYKAQDLPQYRGQSLHDPRRDSCVTRRLSVREAAFIQSFPEEFKFKQSATDAYRQIGNAVPPLLAWHIGLAVQSYLDKLNRTKSSSGKS